MSSKRRSSKKTGAGKSGGGIRCLFRNVCIVLFIIISLPAGYLAAKVFQQLKDMPDIAILEKYEPIEAIQIFDKNDHLICTVEGDEDRRVVPLSQISTQMQQAILAAEDHHFYEHHGINPFSLMRATLVNLQKQRVVEGGSTITQQLIKNLFFEDSGRTFDRKIKEAFMSYEVERRYPKERILEMYLNQVYFGNGGYGIERASQRYFDRSAAALDLAQGAYLAGLVKAPSEYAANRVAASRRQHEILDRMVEFGYVTKSQAEKAKAEQLVFKRSINPLQKYPYYVSFVLEQLRGRFSEAEMRKQGLKVYTNLDSSVQELAETTLNAAIKKAPKGVSQAALVCVSVRDSAVLALVGGVGDYWKNQFNRATNPHTAGSSFKPFVYLTAFLRNVYKPDSVIDDSPLTIKQGWGLPDWSPKNFDRKFMGKITVRKALQLSRNVPAVRIGKAVGIDNVVETARLAGITTKLDANLSLALGSSAVTPFDLAGAYATFARGGVAIKPQTLRHIDNNRGQVIEMFDAKVDRVFDTDAIAKLVDILQDVVRAGTGTAARLPDRPVAGKTGTADAGKDIWFCGFTPDTVCCLWGGNDENLAIPGHNVTGGVVMAKIWKDFMSAYYQMRPTPPGSFLTLNKKIDDRPGDESPAATPSDDENVPNLVPLTGETPGTESPAAGTAPASDEQGAPAPALRPYISLPDDSSTGAQPGALTQPTRGPATVPSMPQPLPQMPPGATAPGAQLPGTAPAAAPSYSTTGVHHLSPTAIIKSDNSAKRTIVNEESGNDRYSSISDPSLNPGITTRRFSRTGSGIPQPTGNGGGTGF